MGTSFTKFNRTVFVKAFAASMAVMAMGAAPPVFAAVTAGVLDQSIFELGPGASCDEGGLTNILEDNQCGTGNSSGPDWSAFFNSAGQTVSNGSGTAVFIKDDASAGGFPDKTTYTSQGSDTNAQKVTDWTWTTASVPSKDDITNAYAYIVTAPNGHTMLYVGAEREVANGDSHLDFEFFQDSVNLDHTPPCPSGTICKFVGTNITPGATFNGKTFDHGDVLVSMDFTNGGAFAGLTVHERTNTGKTNYRDVVSLGAQGCTDLDGSNSHTGANTVCAFSNGGTIDGGPWPNYDGQANVITNLPGNAFTEYGVDLTGLGLGHPCFPTIMVKTRSSQSFTAQLKDFAIRGFETCSASISTQIHDSSEANITGNTVVAGTVFHDTATLNTSGSQAIPTGTVTYSLYNNLTCTGTPASTETVTLTATGSIPNSSDVTAQPGTTISYSASYSGDSNFPAANLAATDCEPLTVAEIHSLVTTDIKNGSPSGASILNTAVDTSGGTVNAVDVATVTATVPSGVTASLGDASCSSPTSAVNGSVTFNRYTTADCTGTPVTEYVCVGATSISNGTATATANSSVDPLTGASFLCIQAKYNGNTAYDPSDPSKKEPLCAFPQVK